MDNTELAKSVLEHLGWKAKNLPEFLMDDRHKRTLLEDDDLRITSHYEEDSLWSLRTVRFLKDFYRYNAGVHRETTNKSFLRTAELFRKMGIKNHSFHLQINNPLIKDLDPWDPELTEEQQWMILKECNENIWYVLREVLKVNGSTRFRGNRAIISFVWCCLNHLPTTILLPRQSGKQLTNDSKIKTKDGWITHGEVKPGDMVIDPVTGKEVEVFNVYPQGLCDIYEITFSDGRVSKAGSEHLWTVFDTKYQKWLDVTTLEIAENLDRDLYIPLSKFDPNFNKGHCVEVGGKYLNGLKIASIRHLDGREECTCIEVDSEDHLYFTDDYIVTHNTVGMQALTFIMQYLVGRGFRSGLITLAASNRMQFVEAIKKMRAALPPYLANMSYKDKDAGNILTYQGFGEDKKNTFEVRVPSGGEDGAENVARGSTFEALLYDEPAWTKYIENIVNGAGPATLTAQKEAREKGIPYYTAKATTPNSILKDEGRYMHDDFMDSTEWREPFFDSFSESHLVQRCIKASPIKTTSPKIGMVYNHLQLGFGKNWVKETMDKLGLSWSKAKIDLLMMWTEEGMNKLFDDFTREKLADGKEEFARNEEVMDTGLFVDWFIDQIVEESYRDDPEEYILMGMDTSDANDRDACTLVLRRIKSGEVIATGRYPLAFLDDVTDVVKELLIRIPNSMLIIERNRAAMMIERLLIQLPAYGIDPFKRIFNDIYQDPVKYKNEFRDLQEVQFKHRTKEFYLRYKRFFGFATTAETRRQMYGFIYEAISLTGSGIRYKLLIDELIGLEVDKDGRIDHKSRGHDDLVIAWLLTYWFIKLGYNKELYGIPPGIALTEIKTLKDNADTPKYTKLQLEFFVKVKERINSLSKEMFNCDNNTLANRIEMEMRKLGEMIPKEMRKTITIDDTIEQAKAERNKRMIENRNKRKIYTF